MNKIKTVFLFVFFLSLLGCSSNNDEGNNVIIDDTPSVININVNGTELYNGNAIVYKTEDNFRLKVGDDREAVFTTEGKLAYFAISAETGGPNSVIRTYGTFKYYPSHTFTFNLQSVDEVNKRVKGTFGGYLFNDNTNLNSESKYVNGTFDLKYDDLVPGVFGLKNQCNINGNQWKDITREIYGEAPYATYTYRCENEYTVVIKFPGLATTVGVHNFTATDNTNNVRISRYDVQTGALINYNTTGTFTVSKIEYYIISGTYSFTAVNPNNPADVLQVTAGEFKLINDIF